VKLPGGERAYIDPRKLGSYALNSVHVDGGAKARVFAAALGLRLQDAPVLERALLDVARDNEAIAMGSNPDGDLYRIDFLLTHRGRTARVRSGWIRPFDGTPTRLTTVFVLRAVT